MTGNKETVGQRGKKGMGTETMMGQYADLGGMAARGEDAGRGDIFLDDRSIPWLCVRPSLSLSLVPASPAPLGASLAASGAGRRRGAGLGGRCRLARSSAALPSPSTATSVNPTAAGAGDTFQLTPTALLRMQQDATSSSYLSFPNVLASSQPMFGGFARLHDTSPSPSFSEFLGGVSGGSISLTDGGGTRGDEEDGTPLRIAPPTKAPPAAAAKASWPLDSSLRCKIG
ncbi:hypothetical protein E2562_024473 [Oryza meyeriana var. granulata]|uniref:Uncharacterized protein n=1 Tax=Oryza meyeriana var. granulata TaxID=110450 RepID=A0A6G1FBS9_9ORYZ|nr:hypothetical protein E2562_024473 [Oryza meyeriana var. granulata]